METRWAEISEWKLIGLNSLSGVHRKVKDQGYYTLNTVDPNDPTDPLESHWAELIEWKLAGLNSLCGVNQKFKDQGH